MDVEKLIGEYGDPVIILEDYFREPYEGFSGDPGIACEHANAVIRGR